MPTKFSIFLDGFLHRLLPPHVELLIDAVHQFQPQHYPALAACAGLGALLASALLYALGMALRCLPSIVSTEAQRARIEHLRAPAQDWLPWMLVLSPVPFGGVLILAAGFFAINPWRVAPMLVMAEVAWRASPLL